MLAQENGKQKGVSSPSHLIDIVGGMIIPKPIPESGFAVPLRAVFLVFKRWPLIGVASNNMNPSLTLFEDHLAYNVLKPKRRSYSELVTIDARQWFGGQNVILHWRGALFAVSANVGQAAALVALLEYFAYKGFALSDSAKKIVNNGEQNEKHNLSVNFNEKE